MFGSRGLHYLALVGAITVAECVGDVSSVVMFARGTDVVFDVLIYLLGCLCLLCSIIVQEAAI